jgi:cytochrome c553
MGGRRQGGKNGRMRRYLPLLLLLPTLGLAASNTRQEFQAAARAKPDLARGAELYNACAACHGADGNGAMDGSRPRIAGQYPRVIIKQLVDFRHGQHWDVQMEAAVSRHRLATAQEIADVAAYVSRLPIPATNELGAGEATPLGAALYRTRCEGCHGANAEGNDRRGVPRLARQHYGYLLRQIYDAVDGRRPNLTPSHRGKLDSLSFEEVKALADHLSRTP